MATTTSPTTTGQTIQSYLKYVLDNAKSAGNAAMTAGYPGESAYTQAYYAGIPYLYQYGDPEQAQALARSGDLYNAYGQAGGYNRTNFGDIEQAYGQAGNYNPYDFTMADYTTQNIQNRMSPYEELVSARANARLKKAYDEARGEREAQAIRSGAFGGSAAAVQEEVARRNYLDQMADMNAQNLQSAFESGAGLYSKEIADRLAAEQANEASRQFANNAEFAGLGGQLSARQQTAAQEAAAKEAQFTGLAGQMDSAKQQAALAEQQKNMQLANLAAMQSAGQQKESEQAAKNQYNLDIAGKQANILGTAAGTTASPVPTSQTKSSTSTLQNILGGLSAGAGIVSGLGGLFGREGGVVPGGLQSYAMGGMVTPGYYDPRMYGGYTYAGGGLASLEPEYYTEFEY